MKRTMWILIFIALMLLLVLAIPDKVGADGIFQPCKYINDCRTFTSNFSVENYEDGILVEGTVPKADLAIFPNRPLEIIVTTGNVYTLCRNYNSVSTDGDVLWRGKVIPGHFSKYIELAEGKYNITVYMGQKECGNCPQAWVVPLDVVHGKTCVWTTYILKGNYPCYLNRNIKLNDKKGFLPFRYDGTDYMYGLCDLKGRVDCDEKPIPDVDFEWNGKFGTSCEIPECTACP